MKFIINTTARWEAMRRLYLKPFGALIPNNKGFCFTFLAWYFEVNWK